MRSMFCFVLLSAVLFSACDKDVGSLTVTYTKAIAIYDDLAEIRATPLVEAARTVENPGKIFVGEDFLLIGEEGKGIHVVDNRDPRNPTPLHFLNIPDSREFYVHEQTIYAESMYDVVKINIENIDQAVLESRAEFALADQINGENGEVLVGFEYEEVTETLDANSDVHNVWKDDQRTYYFDYQQNIIPPSTLPSSFVGTSSGQIGTANRIAYAADHVYVVGLTTMTTLRDNGALEWTSSQRLGGDIETVYPYEDKLFVGTRQSMMIFELNDPANPTLTSTFFHGTGCDPVYPEGDLAYVTLRTGDVNDCPGNVNALVVVDVSNIRQPEQVKEIEMISPFGLSKVNDRLYVGEGKNGLKIFDLDNPRDPQLLAYIEDIEAYDIIAGVHHSNLVLIAGLEGLTYYEIEGTTLTLLSEFLY
ncbi:MAG: hypothetical protein AAGI23_07785 [Bacteroidota bacterium]